MNGKQEECIQGLLGKVERKGPSERPRHMWEDNIEICLRETGWGVMVWIHLAQDTDQMWALMNTVMILRVP
jgi:hypothetical protein